MMCEYKAGLVAIWLMLLTISIMDLLGIGLVGILVVALFGGDGEVSGGFVKLLRGLGIDESRKIPIILITLGIFVLKSFASIFMQYRIYQFGAKVLNGLINDVADALYEAPYDFHYSGNSSSRVKSAMTSTSLFVNHSVIPSLKLMADSVLALAVVIFLLIISPIATLAVACFVLGVGGGYLLLFRGKVEALGDKYLIMWEHVSTDIRSLVLGFKELKVYRCWPYFKSRIHENGRQFSGSLADAQFLKMMPRYLFELVMVIGFLGGIAGYILINDDVTDLLSVSGMFLAAGVRLLPAATGIISSLTSVANAEGASQDLFDVLSYKGIHSGGEESQATEVEIEPSNITVRIDDIWFRYPGRGEWVLEGINFTINPGDIIGLYGASGAGKSTFLDILLGFHEPSKGRVQVEGAPRIPLRQFVSYVPQTPILLDDSVRANIAFGIAPEDIDDARVSEAIRQCQLSKFVSSLPDGVKSKIGENAGSVSGGQRQRIALARAFYSQRPVLILDEATSAVDIECEEALLESIAHWGDVQIIILVGHRPELFSHCNRVYCIDGGSAHLRSSDLKTVEQVRKFMEGSDIPVGGIPRS